MESKVDLDNQSFFGKGVEFWLGKIVKFSDQKSQTSGNGWGWRYKVRIIGDYSNSDSVEDKDVHTALALIPTTGGTGGAGKKATVKLTQGDIVFGVFLVPNNNFPVILGALGRTKESSTQPKDGTKFETQSGFTAEQKAGLTQNQEYSGQDQIVTPRIKEGTEKGNGKTKSTPTEKLSEVKGGNDPNENAVDAIYQPELNTTKAGKDSYQQPVVDEPVVDDPTQTISPNVPNDAAVLNARYNAQTNKDIAKLERQMNRRSTSEEEKIRLQESINTLKKDQIKVNNDFKGSQSIVEYPITSSEKTEVINKINKKNNITNAKEVLDFEAPADAQEVKKLQYDYAKEVQTLQVEKVKKETNTNGPDIKLLSTNTGSDRRNSSNQRKNALLLRARYGGTGYSITIGDETYQPWDAGYRDAVTQSKVIPSSPGGYSKFEVTYKD